LKWFKKKEEIGRERESDRGKEDRKKSERQIE
jgi:hypothetical protein